MRKRILALILTGAMVVSLSGCAVIDWAKSLLWGNPVENLRTMGRDSGYENAFEELTEAVNTELDEASFLRMQQNYEGLPVYGRTVVYVTDLWGKTLAVTGNPMDVDEDLDLDPSITESEAQAAVADYIGDASVTLRDEDLCVYNLGEDGVSHLAYCLTLGGYELIVDAHDGQLLAADSFLRTDDEAPTEVSALWGQATEYPDIAYYKNEGINQLHDPARKIYTAIVVNKHDKSLNQYVVDYDYDVKWVDGELPDPFAVDAYVNAQRTYDFFEEVLDNKGTDGNGEAEIIIGLGFRYFNDKDQSDNGYSGSNTNQMFTQIGFGVTYLHNTARIDTVAHEYMHGVTAFHGGLTYAGESGAIDEGLADIFGELAEGWYTESTPDWDHPSAGRNLANPEKSGYPSYYQGENWDPGMDVHQNSTVISHAAYLMSREGGGYLNAEELAKLWYRAMLMMNTDCTFVQCRMLVEQAALIMGLNDEQLWCISDAFDQVGIPGTHQIILEQGGQLEVLDRTQNPYDNYIVEVYQADVWHYDSTIMSVHPMHERLQEYIDTLILVEAYDVDDTDPLIVDYDTGLYLVRLIDKADLNKSVSFFLRIREDSAAYNCIRTPFGSIQLGGQVIDGNGDPLTDVTVELRTRDGIQTTQTNEEGYAFDIPDDLISGKLTFHKEGYHDKTMDFTLVEADFESPLIIMTDVCLEEKPHPYASIVADYEATYGKGHIGSVSYGLAYVEGVFYLDLLDFNADGVEELVMGYYGGASSSAGSKHKIKIWTTVDGEAELLYTDYAMHGSDVSQWFSLLHMDGKWYVGSGYVGYEDNVTFYGMGAEEFYRAVSFGFTVGDRSSSYYANGETITQSTYQAYYNTYFQAATEYDCLYSEDYNEEEIQDMLKKTAEIREFLGVGE
ncbi:MAG: M4 family metallopeptidase [Oscillospiraceae bacterium]|nr:M4 family metallopeptidase [Oscillospiraceae bacterium]